MLVNVNVTAHRPVIVITRAEYDLLREKASLLNQVCAIQKKWITKDYKYHWDYEAAMEDLLNELILSEETATAEPEEKVEVAETVAEEAAEEEKDE